jgi:hypothetical protein
MFGVATVSQLTVLSGRRYWDEHKRLFGVMTGGKR